MSHVVKSYLFSSYIWMNINSYSAKETGPLSIIIISYLQQSYMVKHAFDLRSAATYQRCVIVLERSRDISITEKPPPC